MSKFISYYLTFCSAAISSDKSAKGSPVAAKYVTENGTPLESVGYNDLLCSA